jgi:hypothetical protein
VTEEAREGTAPGQIFVAPKNGPDEAGPGQDGCLILDNEGQPVWFRSLQREDWDVMDFKLQRYRARPVLTWWEGPHTGYGQGEFVIADESYREVTRVRAGNGYKADHHEFQITPEGTALFDIYGQTSADLSGMGGERDATVLDGIVQEVDIETGEVLSEFGPRGDLLVSVSYPTEGESYRAFRFPWSGQPQDDDPAVAAEFREDGQVAVYASWNGATEVAEWEVLAGPGPDRLEPVGTAPRKGFETVITVETAEQYIKVRAKGDSGRVLGASRAIKREG